MWFQCSHLDSYIKYKWSNTPVTIKIVRLNFFDPNIYYLEERHFSIYHHREIESKELERDIPCSITKIFFVL